MRGVSLHEHGAELAGRWSPCSCWHGGSLSASGHRHLLQDTVPMQAALGLASMPGHQQQLLHSVR